MLTQSFSNVPVEELLARDDTLIVVPLTSKCEPTESGIIESGIEGLGTEQLSEVWSVAGKVTRGQTGDNYWSKSDDLICVAQWLSEEQCTNIEESVYNAYMSIFSVLKEHNFLQPFRFWNYLPNINTGAGDEEIYKRFCTGRLNAFEALDIAPENFPSASALGHHTEGAVIYVFASAAEPMHLRNDKQVNAYDYPRQYGISSPSFTRATALNLVDTPFLFISGTASIIGHKSVEVGNLERQLEVTSDNIEHLLKTANPYNRELKTFKVYLRHPHHLEQTRAWLKKRYPHVEAVITLADICRIDLLVEIECFCQ